MTIRLLLASTLLALSAWCQAATEVMPLNYRMAEELLPVVQSVLGNEGKVTPYGNQLIVNASPAKLEEVRNLLGQLDTQPRRLLISVDSSDNSSQQDRGYRADGSISAGNAQVQIGQGEQAGRDQVRIIRRSTNSRSGGTQQVQTSEGYPALIQVGQSVPLTQYSTGPYGQVHSDTQYRDVTRGFYVTASLTGDIAHITISSNRDRLNSAQPGVIDVQSTDTRVSGRVGEWISIGGISEQSQVNQNGIAVRRATEGREDMTLRVKVDIVE